MATAAEIQTAAQAVVDAQAALTAAQNTFNTREGAAYDACTTEQQAAATALEALEAALTAARNGDPDHATAVSGLATAQADHVAAVIALNDALASYDGQ